QTHAQAFVGTAPTHHATPSWTQPVRLVTVPTAATRQPHLHGHSSPRWATPPPTRSCPVLQRTCQGCFCAGLAAAWGDSAHGCLVGGSHRQGRLGRRPGGC